MILLEALSMNPTSRRPVWMMRQAGRYMASFRKMREKYTFVELCKSPELALEISMQPMNRYPLDASIVFSDILFPLEAMGADLAFTDKGPVLTAPKNADELKKLRRMIDPQVDTASILGTIKLLRKEVPAEKAVLGFAGAPFTMLAYLLEGKLTKDLSIMKKWMAEQPKVVHEWLDVLSDILGVYLEAQVGAGANAVQLFDTWAGQLSPDDFETFALPYARKVLSEVTAPSLYYINGIAGIIESAQSVGSQGLSIDWRISLKEARAKINPVMAIQGNLDPYTLMSSKINIREKTFRMLDAYGTGPGHLVNLGHGMVPGIPEEGVDAFVAAVQEWSAAALKN